LSTGLLAELKRRKVFKAYRIVGNNRTFDFIRQWDEIVYNACKGT
jgi:hypothetical protein